MTYQVIQSANRDEWLLQRSKYIGASDVPSLMGESAWKTAEDVIQAKMGNGVPFEGNVRTYWGRVSEDSILQGFSELCNVHLTPNRLLMVNPGVVGLAATPDAIVDFSLPGPCARDLPAIDLDKVFHSSYTTFLNARRDGIKAVVDAKCVASRGRSKWNKPPGPPQEYFGQLQAQMLVTGLTLGILVAKVDAHEMYAYAIEADPWYQDLIQAEVSNAWRRIKNGS